MSFAFGGCVGCCNECAAFIEMQYLFPDVSPEASGCYMYVERESDGSLFSGIVYFDRFTNGRLPGLASKVMLENHQEIGDNYTISFGDCYNELPTTGVFVSGCDTYKLNLVPSPKDYTVSGYIMGCPRNLGLPGATVKAYTYNKHFARPTTHNGDIGTTDSNGYYEITITGILPKLIHKDDIVEVHINSAPSVYSSSSGMMKSFPFVLSDDSGIFAGSMNARLNGGYICIDSPYCPGVGGPMPPLCYNDGCGSVASGAGYVMCEGNYSVFNDYDIMDGSCHNKGGSSRMFVSYEIWLDGCSINVNRSLRSCQTPHTMIPGDPNCNFTSKISNGPNSLTSPQSSTTRVQIDTLWGPLGTMPPLNLNNWVHPKASHCISNQSNYVEQLFQAATIGPCGTDVTLNVVGSPGIETFVTVYNSGATIIIASGQTNYNGSYTWSLPSGDAPWLAVVDGTECYTGTSGYINVGSNTINLGVNSNCVKYSSPCELCSGRAYSKTLYSSDNFGSKTLNWVNDSSGWASDDFKYQLNCQSGWSLMADTPSGIYHLHESSGTLSVECVPLLLEATIEDSNTFSIIITE